MLGVLQISLMGRNDVRETPTQSVAAWVDLEILSRHEGKQGQTLGDRNGPHDHWVQMPAEPDHRSQKRKGLRRQERLVGGCLVSYALLLLKWGYGFSLFACYGELPS